MVVLKKVKSKDTATADKKCTLKKEIGPRKIINLKPWSVLKIKSCIIF